MPEPPRACLKNSALAANSHSVKTAPIMSAAPTRGGIARVFLVGNPNTGKSTLFNRLTGLRQRVGNYPGVTVERKTGTLRLGDREVEVVDLPGSYSLAAASPDERVVIDALSGRIGGLASPDLVVCVVDATNIQRNLFLASQIADAGIPLIIALNLVDAARRAGLRIDCDLLSRRLGVPVVPTVAVTGEGVEALRAAMGWALEFPPRMTPIAWPACVSEAMGRLREALGPFSDGGASDAELRRVLFDSEPVVLERLGVSREHATAVLGPARDAVRHAGFNPLAAEALLQYEHIGALLESVVEAPERPRVSKSESVDRVLTHRWWGLAVFATLMYLVFQSIYTWAVPLMDAIEAAKGWAQGVVSASLAGAPMLESLVSDGIVEGVGAMLVFLPQILILFFFIALLEDTGYMARAAFLMDRLFGWCGLNGKSFVPLLSSYACAVPGVLSARVIEDPKARLATILIAPLMSCSARLPVYVLMIGAFVEPRYGPFWAGAALFAMHFVGLLVALPVAALLNRFLLRTKPQPFLLEMPPYRVPRLRDVLWRMAERGWEFIWRAGTVILAITVIIWAMLYFPRPPEVGEAARRAFVAEVAAERGVSQEVAGRAISGDDGELAARLESRLAAAYVEQSIMGRIGRTLQPIFDPAGFDWKVTVGVVASFPAREVIIATLGVIYSLGGDVDEASGDLRAAMAAERWTEGARAGAPVFTLATAFAVMVFFALCQQCGATVAVVAQETHWRWALFSFCCMTALAWLGAVAVYQVGTWMGWA